MNTLYLRIAFAALVALVVYPYTLYPLALWLLSHGRPRPWKQREITPRLSVIVAAHNEEKVLADKLDNTLAFDYPEDRLEILVASDGSTDRTDEIAAAYAPQVTLVRLDEQSGKQVALNRAVEASTGDVLLFTDASVFLAPHAAQAVARNFGDPRVGAHCLPGVFKTIFSLVTGAADEPFGPPARRP